MGLIDDLLARNPPTILYHYTSQAGLLGIITSRSLWATSIHHMNDAREFAHAGDVMRSVLFRLEKEVSTPLESKLFGQLTAALESVGRINIHVFSLSEEGDLLSQWRAYCPRGSGYAIGFSPDDLKGPMHRQGFFLAPCAYDWGLQEKIVSHIVDAVLESFRAALKAGTPVDDPLLEGHRNLFAREFVRVAPVLKHPSFREEKEWRMISRPVPFDHPQRGHRAGGSMVIPHFVFSLGDTAGEISIKEVIVGPTPHRDLATSSVTSLLQREGVRWGQVTPSQIPYREV